MADKKQQVKCPVCGRFTSEKCIKGYDDEKTAKIDQLASALQEETHKKDELREKLCELEDYCEDLQRRYEELVSRTHKKGFFAKLFGL